MRVTKLWLITAYLASGVHAIECGELDSSRSACNSQDHCTWCSSKVFPGKAVNNDIFGCFDIKGARHFPTNVFDCDRSIIAVAGSSQSGGAALAQDGSRQISHFFTCSGVEDQLGIYSVAVTPKSEIAGQSISVQMLGRTSVDFSGGRLTIGASVAGVNVVSLDFDACSVLGIECPKAAGEKWAAHLSLMVPSHMPGGVMADIQIRIVNDIGVEVTCAVVRERLKKKSALRASSSIGEAEFLFRAWAQQHGVSLGSSAEYSARLGVFESNHQLIMAHNSEPGVSWEMGHNQFSALTAEEFEEEYLRGLSPADAIEPEEADFALRAHPPTAVDWTTRGAVTAVHDQGKCGSCWAFASVGALEGAWFLKTGALVRMSEQQLVDCDVNSVGCNGGFMTNALYYAKAHGLSSFEDYQYLGYYGGFCRGGCTALPPGAITMVAAVPKGDEGALAKAIALQPVAVAVNATDWRFYKSGIYTGECEPKPNHGVLAVGYGPGFFKIKNSWGIGWGESGYIRLQAGLNKCGIANDASYPIM